MTGTNAAIAHAQQGYGAPGAAGVPMAVPAVLDGVRRIEKVLLFDLYNPWAAVLELGGGSPNGPKR